MCNINSFFDTKNMKNKTLVTIPMALIFMNVPPSRKLFIIHARGGKISIQQKIINIWTFENKAQI